MEPRYSYDGHGLNDVTDHYRPRLATFAAGITPEQRDKHGKLWEAAPETAAERDRLREVNKELVEAVEGLKRELDTLRWGKPFPGRPHTAMDAADAAIAKAKGGA